MPIKLDKRVAFLECGCEGVRAYSCKAQRIYLRDKCVIFSFSVSREIRV